MVTGISYDEEALIVALRNAKPRQRIAFALACAQRLVSGCGSLAFQEYRTLLASVAVNLEWLWPCLSVSKTMADVEHVQRECDALIPNGDEGEDEFSVLMEHAAAAVSYAADCLQSGGDAQTAAYAARRAYEAADYVVTEFLGISAADEDAVLRHPVVARELRRQARDVAVLDSIDPEMLRSRAIADGIDVFIELSAARD